jgi:DNA-binding transcriptional LysR family regulator
MELDLHKLNHFVVLAEELNFTRAAERLGMGQQALSASIRRLEVELDAPLFIRSTRRVALTEAGSTLLDESRALLAAARATLTRVREANSVGAGSLRVGHPPSIPQEMVAEFTHAWRARQHARHLVFRSHWFDEIPDKVAAGELDVGLGRMFEAREDLEFTTLGAGPLRLAVRADHRLAGQREVALAELNHEQILDTFGPGWEVYRDRFVDFCRRAGFEATYVDSPVKGVFGSEILLEVAKGVAFVWEPAGPAASGGVVVLDLRPPLMLPVVAVTNPRARPPFVAEFLESAARALSAAGDAPTATGEVSRSPSR